MRLVFPLLLAAAGLAACGDNVELEQSDAPVTPSLQLRIDQAVARISGDTCFSQSDTSGCQWANYSVGSGHFDMAPSTGEAILIIDSFGEGVYPHLLRYRNRILGFYRASGDAVVAENLSMRLPKQLGDSLLSFAGPEFIPSVLLAEVGRAASAAYRNVPLLFLGHGGIVFGHLVELAPEQPLVLLDMTGFLGLLPTLCNGPDEAAMSAARAHFTALAASLRTTMRAHNVRFINASFGDSLQTISADWSRTCNAPVPSAQVLRQLLHLYDPIYDALFNTEGVVAAHAATNLGNAEDFPFDQPSAAYPNRVRNGFFSSLSSGLDAEGRGAVRKVEQFPRDGNADVYLNWACEPFVGCATPHYEMAGAFGLNAFSVVVMSSSYVNPLGLGRLIHLRYSNHGGEPLTNELIGTLRQELTPQLCGTDGAHPCVYQDPITHRQLEVYRRNYR